MAGEFTLSVTYGIPIKQSNDPYINAAEEGLRAIFTALVPGAFLVDTFPWLRWMPEWMPGAGFKTKARKWRKTAETMLNAPFEATKREIVSHLSPPLFSM
jgi:hypothetical protein